MSELADLVEAFKREVTIPGAFTTDFPDTTDEMIVGSLADAFAEAQLDGFFGNMVLDVDLGVVTPDLSTAGAALVVMYAGMRLTRQRLLATNTVNRYKAGPVEYETQQAAGALTEALKQLKARRDQILANAIRAGRGNGTTFVLDAYVSRQWAYNLYGGFFPYEIASRAVPLGIG